jgi:hypothetical protein
MNAPLNDSIIVAISKLVDDAQSDTRSPSHADIDVLIQRAGLTAADPKTQGQTLGKAKRINRTLSWALENEHESGRKLVTGVISFLKGCGGFRSTSTNFVGTEGVDNAINVFRLEGFNLTTDGELLPLILDNLSSVALSSALNSYVQRAKKGSEDAALIAGTSKDLLEATAAHILTERFGSYSNTSNFPTLLGQAFTVIGFATLARSTSSTPTAQERIQTAMYDAACAINTLRNKQGTGHGRPWVSTITDAEAKTAIQLMGTIAEAMLEAHKMQSNP